MIQIIKELSLYFSDRSFVFVVLFVLLLSGGFLWIFPDSSYLAYGIASGELFIEFMIWAAILWVPVVATGFITYESNANMLDNLSMLNIGWHKIILYKFVAAYIVVSLVCLLALVNVLILSDIGINGIQDNGQLWVSFIVMLAVIAVYVAVSLAVACYFSGKVSAVAFSVLFCFILYEGMELLARIPGISGSHAFFVKQLGLSYHAGLFNKGILTISSLVYLGSLIIFFVYIGVNRFSSIAKR